MSSEFEDVYWTWFHFPRNQFFFSQLKVFLNSLCNLSYASVFEPPTSISQVLDYNCVAQTFDLNFFPMFSNLLSFPVFPSTLRKPFIFFIFIYLSSVHILVLPWHGAMWKVRVQLKWVYSLVFSTMVMKILWINQLGGKCLSLLSPLTSLLLPWHILCATCS